MGNEELKGYNTTWTTIKIQLSDVLKGSLFVSHSFVKYCSWTCK